MFKHQLCISAPIFTCLVSIHDGLYVSVVIKSQIDIEACYKIECKFGPVTWLMGCICFAFSYEFGIFCYNEPAFLLVRGKLQ